MSDVALVIAVTFVLVLYVGTILQVKFGLAGVFGTQMIILLVPLLVVLYTKKDIFLTYGFAKTGARSYIGGVFLAIGFYFINIIISTGLVNLFPSSATNVTTTFSSLMSGNVWSILLVIAIAPAVCEEMLFRGVIFHSMKAKYRISTAILAVAALFGLYHMSLVKFIPTGLLGFVLCCVVYKTGSIFPAMMIHFINNGISVLFSCYPEQMEKVLPVLMKETLSVSDVLLVLGAGLVLFGIGLLIMKPKQEKKETI